MEPSASTEEAQKKLIAELLDVGSKLGNPPSSNDELLSLLLRAEYLLPKVPQNCPCHMAMCVQDAARPAIHAFISDKIFKHHCPDIQVVVGACMNEIVRLTIPDYPYSDAQMKDVFGLIMGTLKHLHCGSGKNFERASKILEIMADTQSCLIMLDLEVQMGTMVVEMFQLFLETIKPHHSADIFNHMNKIMIVIVQEDEFPVELPRTLLSSVRLDNKDTSPRSWELGKSVIENCATILQKHIRQAVKENNLNLADYAGIVASLCQDAPSGNDTVQVANEKVANVQVTEEVARVQVEIVEAACVQLSNLQLANQEVTTVNEEVETVQLVATNASGIGVSKLDGRAQAGQGMQMKPERRKIKPNTLMRPEEGYKHARLGGVGGFSQFESNYVNRVSVGKRDQSKNKKSTMNQDNTRDVSDKQEKTTKTNHSASDSKLNNDNEITAQKHESEGVVDKEVESFMSKPPRSKPSKVEKKGSNKGKKISSGVVQCSAVGEGNSKASKVNENEIISKKHELGVVSHKEVESSKPKPTKAEQSKRKKKGLNKCKEETKSVVQSDTLHAQKEAVGHSGIDPQRDDENDINSQKHEKCDARNVADKVVESAMSRKAEDSGDLVSDLEKELMDFHLGYGKELVNLKIMVWWPLDKTYYTGTVESYDRVTKTHKIKYDDGDEEILDMSVEKWELFDERQSQQVAQLGERKAGTAPAKEPARTPEKRTKSKAGSSKKGSAAAGPSSKWH